MDHRNAEKSDDRQEVRHHLLSAQFDLPFDYALECSDYTLDAKINRLLIETASRIEPVNRRMQVRMQPLEHCIQ